MSSPFAGLSRPDDLDIEVHTLELWRRAEAVFCSSTNAIDVSPRRSSVFVAPFGYEAPPGNAGRHDKGSNHYEDN